MRSYPKVSKSKTSDGCSAGAIAQQEEAKLVWVVF